MEKLKVMNFSERNFKKLPELLLSNKILNTEAKLYIYSKKDKWKEEKELIKVFYNTEPEVMANKIFVLGQLLQRRNLLTMSSLVVPTSLVSVDGNIIGYAMPWIMENNNMVLLLQNPNVPLKEKLNYLKEIYTILETLKRKQAGEDNPIYLGDIHESNFILNVNTQKIQAVDIDSAYIEGALAPISKFLSSNENFLPYLSTYPIDYRTGNPIPSENTTIASFVFILLNSLSMDKSFRWSYEDFYRYLDFLYQSGMSQNLLQDISNIYSNVSELHFCKEYLEEIDPERNYILQKRR